MAVHLFTMGFRTVCFLFVLKCITICTNNVFIHNSQTALNRILEKSLSLCVVDRNDPALVSNPDESIQDIAKCFNHKWFKCKYLQNQIRAHIVKNVSYTNQWPCFRSSFLCDSIGQIVYDIYGHETFQFNLTFTEFNLRQSHLGCVYHHIKVI